MADQGSNDFPADLLEQLQAQAHVLGVIDETQDIALALHESPFDPDVRQRATRFLDSARYHTAAQQLEVLIDEAPEQQCPEEDA